MKWTALSCVAFAIFLGIQAEPAVSSPKDSGGKALPPDSSATLYNSGGIVREGALLLLRNYVKHEDTVVKEQVKDVQSNLKEQLREGDKLLKDRIEEGLAHEKEGRQVGDDRLNEELDEDVAWLKAKMAKGRRQMEDELAEEEEQTNKEITELKEAFEKLLRDSAKQWAQPAMMEDLKQMVYDIQAELNSTQHQLQTAQRTHREELQSLRSDLHTAQQKLQMAQEELSFLKTSAVGSSFIRWGNAECPENTSLVYSGVAGGTRSGDSGGASNYLCLMKTPQLDNTTHTPYHNGLRGAQYQDVEGHDDQDVVCSVCRAPQATTLMIPGTLTCPSGWATRYRGHLMSEHYNSKGRTEYVCVDKDRQHRQGGQENEWAVEFCHVVAKTGGSLPWPVSVNDKVVTCVVCSV
ncbi:uncharacterized protein LOC143285407 [Babylonia areolata]|uniref:uncharacterized protein LOC143285407 n=1 Tax=Babylonia areolata TaxID=304850 RepID=UPI003FD40352